MIPRFVVEEFLLWLWFVSDNGSHVGFSEELPDWTYPLDRPDSLDLWLDGKVSLERDSEKAAFQGDKMGNDAKEALRIGKRVSAIKLVVRENELEYKFVLDTGLFRFKLTTPHIDFEDTSTQAVVFGTVAATRRAEQLLDHLLCEFLQRRFTEKEALTLALSSFVAEVEVDDLDGD